MMLGLRPIIELASRSLELCCRGSSQGCRRDPSFYILRAYLGTARNRLACSDVGATLRTTASVVQAAERATASGVETSLPTATMSGSQDMNALMAMLHASGGQPRGAPPRGAPHPPAGYMPPHQMGPGGPHGGPMGGMYPGMMMPPPRGAPQGALAAMLGQNGRPPVSGTCLPRLPLQRGAWPLLLTWVCVSLSAAAVVPAPMQPTTSGADLLAMLQPRSRPVAASPPAAPMNVNALLASARPRATPPARPPTSRPGSSSSQGIAVSSAGAPSIDTATAPARPSTVHRPLGAAPAKASGGASGLSLSGAQPTVDLEAVSRTRGLHAQNIIQVYTDRPGHSGRLIAANQNFVAYTVRKHLIRIVHNEADVGIASPAHAGGHKALLRGHESPVVDMAFACRWFASRWLAYLSLTAGVLLLLLLLLSLWCAQPTMSMCWLASTRRGTNCCGRCRWTGPRGRCCATCVSSVRLLRRPRRGCCGTRTCWGCWRRSTATAYE